MMPVIRISDSTFKALQSLAVPLIDTPGSIIDKLVKAELARAGRPIDLREDDTDARTRDFDPLDPPGLTHTKIVDASVNGRQIARPRWAALLIEVIAAVQAQGYSGKALADRLNIPARTDEFTEQGFKYYPRLKLSVQGQSAQDAWKEIARLATAHGITVGVVFRWRDKEGADYPGVEGTMTIGAPA